MGQLSMSFPTPDYPRFLEVSGLEDNDSSRELFNKLSNNWFNCETSFWGLCERLGLKERIHVSVR